MSASNHNQSLLDKQQSATKNPLGVDKVNEDLMLIKPSLIVESMASVDEPSHEYIDKEIKENAQFDSAMSVSNILEDEEVRDGSIKNHAPKRKKFWILLSLGVIGLSIAEMGIFTWQVFTHNDWLGGAWLIILLLALGGISSVVVSEMRSLKRLKQQNESRQDSADLFNTPAIGLAQEHCARIAKHLPRQYQPLVKNWSDKLQSHYTNSEVISLFELNVLAPIDKHALGNITKHASAAGVMIAVSPFALLDMGIVLWRNISMINQLSRLYGVRLGYWGRIALIKNIFRSMLYAGAMEILSDAGNYALGVGLTGKISTRVAQGLGAGVLTSRIGLKALHECRPMPWLTVKKPGLTQLTNKVMEDLSRYIK